MRYFKELFPPILFFIITFSLLFLLASNATDLKSNIVSTILGV